MPSATNGAFSNPFALPTDNEDSLEEEEEAFSEKENRWSSEKEEAIELPCQYLATQDEPEDQVDEAANKAASSNADMEELQAGVASLNNKPSRRGSSNSTSTSAPNWSGETFEKQQLEGLDDAFVAFQERVFIKAGGELSDQVLRYERSGRPLPFCGKGAAYDLLFATGEYKEDKIANCQQCGSRRTFELQIMPQLVTILSESGPLKDREEELELGWATVWCYFCAADCESQEWQEEVAVVQYEEA